MKRVGVVLCVFKSLGIPYPILNELLKEGCVDMEQDISRVEKKSKVRSIAIISKNPNTKYLKSLVNWFKVFIISLVELVDRLGPKVSS